MSEDANTDQIRIKALLEAWAERDQGESQRPASPGRGARVQAVARSGGQAIR